MEQSIDHIPLPNIRMYLITYSYDFVAKIIEYRTATLSLKTIEIGVDH